MEEQSYCIDLERITPVIGKQEFMYNHYVHIKKQSENISSICSALNNMTDLMIGWIKKIELMNLKNQKHQMFVENKLLSIEHQLNMESKPNLRCDENITNILNALNGMNSLGSNQTPRLWTEEINTLQT